MKEVNINKNSVKWMIVIVLALLGLICSTNRTKANAYNYKYPVATVSKNPYAHLYTDSGDKLEDVVLPQNTDWRINQVKVINGVRMYMVGSSVYLSSQDSYTNLNAKPGGYHYPVARVSAIPYAKLVNDTEQETDTVLPTFSDWRVTKIKKSSSGQRLFRVSTHLWLKEEESNFNEIDIDSSTSENEQPIEAEQESVQVDPDNLTVDQSMELNRYSLDIINSERSKAGVKPLVLNQSAIDFANDIAKRYRQDAWNSFDGHDVAAITASADQHGLHSGGQYYENLGIFSSRDKYDMDSLKKCISTTINNMIYHDAASNWGHKNSLLSAGQFSNYANNFIYYGLSLNQDTKKCLAIHLILVPASLINTDSPFDVSANL